MLSRPRPPLTALSGCFHSIAICGQNPPKMADPAAFLPNPETATLPKPNLQLLREHWEVDFSRFFIFPQEHSSPLDPAPRPLAKATVLRGVGAWITASSPAIILIVKAAPDADAILSVSVAGYVHEEHIVSNLRLTWPQIACEPLWPTRGCRVVFVSYNDSSNQLQKFAVRFQSSAGAANFISCFKDSSRDTIDIMAPASDFMCDSSSPSEMTASLALQYKPWMHRFDERGTNEESANRDESHRPPPLLVKDINSNTTVSGAPLSFRELLTNCSRNHENESIMVLEDASHIPNSGENAPSQSPQDVSEQLGLEDDIKNEIARYMSDASFQDMVFKVEKVIHGLAGDLPF